MSKQMRGTMKFIHTLAIVGLLLEGLSPAVAQSLSASDDLMISCYAGTPQEKITACTTKLSQPNQSPKVLSSDYSARGDGYRDTGQYALAMQDYAQALKLTPGDIFVIDARGQAYNLMRQYDLAIADFTTVLALPPGDFGLRPVNQDVLVHRAQAYLSLGKTELALADSAQALAAKPGYRDAYLTQAAAYYQMQSFSRAHDSFSTIVENNQRSVAGHYGLGYTLFSLGNYAEAEKELQTAADLSPNYAYALLWLHLSRLLQSKDDSSDFALRAAKLTGTDWPAPLIQYFLGHINEEALITASYDKEPKKNNAMQCEANFYVGEDHLIHKNLKHAFLDLKYAADICPKLFVEYGASLGELARMGPTK